LDDLFNAEKISESTFESLNSDISNTITEIEKRQKALAETMTSKITQLEDQINTLEIFLANSEIQHVAGEIDDQLHERESQAFSLGLDALRQQLDSIKGIVSDILPEAVTPPVPAEPAETTEAEVPPTEEIAEEAAEMPVEAPVEEVSVGIPEEAETPSEEIAVEQPTETPEEVEAAGEETTIEQVSEAAIEAAPVEEVPVQENLETPSESSVEELEETVPSPEETVPEPEAASEEELAVEEEVEEAQTATEEETETPTEETSPHEEEIATTEEEAEEETEW
jgi:hypothetical protein